MVVFPEVRNGLSSVLNQPYWAQSPGPAGDSMMSDGKRAGSRIGPWVRQRAKGHPEEMTSPKPSLGLPPVGGNNARIPREPSSSLDLTSIGDLTSVHLRVSAGH